MLLDWIDENGNLHDDAELSNTFIVGSHWPDISKFERYFEVSTMFSRTNARALGNVILI